MAINWSEVSNTKFFKNTGWGDQFFRVPFCFGEKFHQRRTTWNLSKKIFRILMKTSVGWICNEFVKIFGKGTHIFRD